MQVDEDSGFFPFQSPWRNLLLWQLAEAEKDIFICTPAFDMDLLRKLQSMIISKADRGLKVRVLVRFSEMDIISRDLDPEVLRIMALLTEDPVSKVSVRFLSNLSSTTIVIDGRKAALATGDLTTQSMVTEINQGELMMGRDVVSSTLEDLDALWSKAMSVSSKDIVEYMDLLKEKVRARSAQKLRMGPEGREVGDLEMLSLGLAAAPLGHDRKEPRLDETKKIVKELVVRAREAAETGKVEAALFYLEEGLNLDPENTGLLLEKGKMLHDVEKDCKKALACLDRVVAKDPENRDAWAYRGMCLNEMGDIDEALRSYDRATDLDPQYYPVWIDKGTILGKMKGREEDGLKCLEFALTQDPYNEEAWFNKAMILEQKLGKMEEAVMAYRTLIRIDPKHVEGSYRMGLLYYRKFNNIEKAKRYFDNIIEADPKHIEAWLLRAEIAETAEKAIDTAIELLDRAREANPGCTELLTKEIGLLLMDKKKFKRAVDLSRELLAIRPKDPMALHVMGLASLRIDGDAEKALQMMNDSIRSDPNYRPAVLWKANILAGHLNRSKDAVTLLRAALKRDEKDPKLWMELGNIYFNFMYEPKEALKCFDTVTMLEPKSADGWYNKGMVLSRGFEKHEDGLKCLEHATRLNEDHPLAWFEKGRIMARTSSKKDEAIKCFEKAHTIEPEDLEVLTSLAMAYRERNDLEKAVHYYKKAVDVEKCTVEPLLGLAEALSAKGVKDEAHRVLNDALQVDPKSIRVWMTKAEVFLSQKEDGKALECYKRVLRTDPSNKEALEKKAVMEAAAERSGRRS